MTTDAKSSASSDELVRLGKSALQVLQLKAEAAKLNAEKLELEELLGKAEIGDTEQLRDWLQRHQDLSISTESTNSLGKGLRDKSRISQVQPLSVEHVDKEQSLALASANANQEDAWADLLFASRARTASSIKTEECVTPVQTSAPNGVVAATKPSALDVKNVTTKVDTPETTIQKTAAPVDKPAAIKSAVHLHLLKLLQPKLQLRK